MRSPRSAQRVFESSRPTMRSESRTDETSGLVTTTALSANRIASRAPRSMPAGLSQITQSKPARNSLMTRSTPSSVSASLSRGGEAANRCSVSMRLSRISACFILASPCATLMRSYTTRRSAPNTRSRLRNPTSKSTTQTRLPVCASAAPIEAVEVVLPTPPFPDVTTITLLIVDSFEGSIQNSNLESVSDEAGLEAAAVDLGIHVFGRDVGAAYAEQLGPRLPAEDTRSRQPGDPSDHATLQRAIDMNGAARDDLG